MEVFKRYFNEIQDFADLTRKTSLTVPHDSVSVQELFECYVEGSEEIFRRVRERQSEYDGEFDDVINMKISGDLDAISAFELSEQLKERRMLYEQSKERVQDYNEGSNDASRDSRDPGQESSGSEVTD